MKIELRSNLDSWIVAPQRKIAPGLNRHIKGVAFEIEATGEEILARHKNTGATVVQIRKMAKAGWAVYLIDRGEGFEGAIEFGRDDYITTNPPDVKELRSRRVRVSAADGDQLHGGMTGLFILQQAVRAVQARHRRELR